MTNSSHLPSSWEPSFNFNSASLSLLFHLFFFFLVGGLCVMWDLSSLCAKSLQLCLILCNPMNWSLPSSSVHGIFQARILEWVAMPFAMVSSQPKYWTTISYVSCHLASQSGTKPVPLALEVQSLNHWTTREVPEFTILESSCRWDHIEDHFVCLGLFHLA